MPPPRRRLSSPQSGRVETTPATTIIGGGIAGLVVALRLAQGGHHVTLLEASDRAGGQLTPQRIAGVELDAGAESFATRGTAVTALLAELGLDGDIVTPRGGSAWLHRARGPVPLPAAGLLGIPASPLAPDVVRAIGLAGAWRARLDAILPRAVGARSTTLGELVAARMGRAVLDGLVAPVVRGVYSREPDDLPLAVASPTLLDRMREHGSLAAAVADLRANAPAGSLVAGLRGGMFRLVDALADACRRIGVDIRTGVRVDEVPPGAVLAASTPGTPPGQPITVVTLVVKTPLLDGAPRGTGVLVAPGSGVEARALTHLTAKWKWLADAFDGAHAVRLSYDGVPADPITQALRDASTIFGTDLPDPIDSTVRTWHRPAPEPGEHDVTRTGEPVAGSGLAAVVAHAEATAVAILTDSRPATTGERMEE